MSEFDYKNKYLSYKNKYLKYKNKYLQLKNKLGGSSLPASDILDCKIYMILIDNHKKGLRLDQLMEALKVNDIKEIEMNDYMENYDTQHAISAMFKPDIILNPSIYKQIFEINDYDFTGLELINAVSNMGYG